MTELPTVPWFAAAAGIESERFRLTIELREKKHMTRLAILKWLRVTIRRAYSKAIQEIVMVNWILKQTSKTSDVKFAHDMIPEHLRKPNVMNHEEYG
jgi:hypothetical protein